MTNFVVALLVALSLSENRAADCVSEDCFELAISNSLVQLEVRKAESQSCPDISGAYFSYPEGNMSLDGQILIDHVIQNGCNVVLANQERLKGNGQFWYISGSQLLLRSEARGGLAPTMTGKILPNGNIWWSFGIHGRRACPDIRGAYPAIIDGIMYVDQVSQQSCKVTVTNQFGQSGTGILSDTLITMDGGNFAAVRSDGNLFWAKPLNTVGIKVMNKQVDCPKVGGVYHRIGDDGTLYMDHVLQHGCNVTVVNQFNQVGNGAHGSITGSQLLLTIKTADILPDGNLAWHGLGLGKKVCLDIRGAYGFVLDEVMTIDQVLQWGCNVTISNEFGETASGTISNSTIHLHSGRTGTVQPSGDIYWLHPLEVLAQKAD